MKKVNVLVPLAGKGQRFVDKGYNIPKSLILAGNKHIIDWSMGSLKLENCNLIFVVRNEHITNYSIDEILKTKYGNDITVVSTPENTRGSVESCLYAREYINNDLPLLVYCIDIYFEEYFDPSIVDENLDALVLTFKSNSPNYSYCELDKNNMVTRVAEKLVISNNANVGAYYFKEGKDFVECSDEMMERNETVNGEFYIAPVYNIMIEKQKKIGIHEVEKMYVMGTPEELDFYVKVVLNKFGTTGKVALCCDHSGYEMKEFTRKLLDQYNIDYIDYGSYVDKSCDQVDYTKLACKSIQEGLCSHGIGFCRTGQAINITANKFKGIRSALVFNEYTAEYSVRHNGANFFAFASGNIENSDLHKLIDVMLNNTFDGGRHQVRVQKIMELDK
jgi:RpiB/LacA/LacB family sugar-phosphate isomerase